MKTKTFNIFLKEQISLIQEFHEDRDWGWIDPDYRFFSFRNLKMLIDSNKIKNPKILKYLYTHSDFIEYLTNREITSSNVAIKKNWIRWMVTRHGNLVLNFNYNRDREKILNIIMNKLKVEYDSITIEIIKNVKRFYIEMTKKDFIQKFDTKEFEKLLK